MRTLSTTASGQQDILHVSSKWFLLENRERCSTRRKKHQLCQYEGVRIWESSAICADGGPRRTSKIRHPESAIQSQTRGFCYSLAVPRPLEAIVASLKRFYGPLPSPPRDPFALFVWEVLSVHSVA